MATQNMNKLKRIESERVYHYADGTVSRFTNITHVGVTKSGFHKLEDKKGLKFIVAPGWRHITLCTDEWTF